MMGSHEVGEYGGIYRVMREPKRSLRERSADAWLGIRLWWARWLDWSYGAAAARLPRVIRERVVAQAFGRAMVANPTKTSGDLTYGDVWENA